MVVIVGAGLSGLLLAYRLKKAGIPFKVLEARNRVGGRICTIALKNNAPVDLGATWFNRDHSQLLDLLEELDLGYFEQIIGSDVFYQDSKFSMPRIVSIPNQAPTYRIAGGSSRLIQALVNEIGDELILKNQTVKSLTIAEDSVLIRTNDVFNCKAAVLAIPPKLWAKNISFSPNLPSKLMEVALNTHTWMEDSIKFAFNFENPFWREKNLPSTLFSNTGPIRELYDQSNQERSLFALGGFLSSDVKSLTKEERLTIVEDVLVKALGEEVKEFTNYEECDWSAEEYTYQDSDAYLFPHQNNGHPLYRETLLGGKLFISSTEAAEKFPGYMEGAVQSANEIADKIIENT